MQMTIIHVIKIKQLNKDEKKNAMQSKNKNKNAYMDVKRDRRREV